MSEHSTGAKRRSPHCAGSERIRQASVTVSEGKQVCSGDGVQGKGLAFEAPCPPNTPAGEQRQPLTVGLGGADFPHRFAAQLDAMRVVNQAVEDTVRHGRISGP